MTVTPPPDLTRSALAAADLSSTVRPVRIVHLGLGAFHRAHQAWYTDGAADRADWGIAAFAGRSDDLARTLERQGGVYTLVERGPQQDRFEHVESIQACYGATQVTELLAALAHPDTAIVTLTITEAGYSLTPDGTPDQGDIALADDLDRLRVCVDPSTLRPTTPLGKLLVGLDARRRADAGPVAIVPCDNFPGNGTILGRAVLELAEATVPELAVWLPDNVAFVSTSVDRITPRVEAGLENTVAEGTGWGDRAPVATEPFSDWVLSGAFPAGRPRWEDRGARFVDDIEPYELRKLRLLNGAHSLLAYLGLLRKHATVAQAMSDPFVAETVERWWDEAAATLSPSVDTVDYREALTRRFLNARIEHSLAQISSDGLTKLGVRVVPVARWARDNSHDASASALIVAAWIAAVQVGLVGPDSRAADVERAIRSVRPAEAMLRLLSPELATDAVFAEAVASHLTTLTRESH